MPCKLCGENKKLVDSHIIPRSFFAEITTAGEILRQIASEDGIYPKRSPKGVYDNILCADCEARFSHWDDYGYDFLMRNTNITEIQGPDGAVIAVNLGECDANLLLMFFLSLIWRAHHSAHEMFTGVDLGPYADRIADLILKDGEGTLDDPHYAVALSRFNAPAELTGLLNPQRAEYDGINHYKVYLGGYMAALKVSNQPGLYPYTEFYIRAGMPVVAVVRNFNNSKELKVIGKMLRKPENQDVGL